MSKHTPGSWFVRYCDDDYYQRMAVISSKDFGPSNTTQYADEPSTVAIVYHQLSPTVGVDRNNEEQDSNIRLIAAAPDLLEALEYLLSHTNTRLVDVTSVKAAIAKAKGETE